MSELSRWTYTSIVRVKPFIAMNMATGVTDYGEEFDIACCWIAESAQMRTPDGAEFVSKYLIFTEDARPKYLDMVLLPDESDWQEIRARTKWDMSMFADTPDYRLATG